MAAAIKKGIWKNYDKTGDKVSRKNKSCPKCGEGFFMAKHANRHMCGKCQYVEYVSK